MIVHSECMAMVFYGIYAYITIDVYMWDNIKHEKHYKCAVVLAIAAV